MRGGVPDAEQPAAGGVVEQPGRVRMGHAGRGERSGVRAERVRAVREARVCGRLPHGSQRAARRRHHRHRLREVHRVRAVPGGVPVRRAQAQPHEREHVRRRRARALRVLRRAARAGGREVHLLRGPAGRGQAAGMRGELPGPRATSATWTTRRARCRSSSPATRRCCAWTRLRSTTARSMACRLTCCRPTRWPRRRREGRGIL